MSTHGGTRQGAGRPNYGTKKIGIPSELLNLVRGMVAQYQLDPNTAFETLCKDSKGYTRDLISGTFINSKEFRPGESDVTNAALYLSKKGTLTTFKPPRPLLTFVGPRDNVVKCMNEAQGLDIETICFFAELNELTRTY